MWQATQNKATENKRGKEFIILKSNLMYRSEYLIKIYQHPAINFLNYYTRGIYMEKEKSESKKLIPLYLQKLFLEKTDKTHYIRMPDILSFLESKNIFADRRTVYAAISLLNYTDFEIKGVQEKGGYKYHHPSRLFNTNELKFLIDSIATSKFLTEKKSKELINKIKFLGSSNNIFKGNNIFPVHNPDKSSHIIICKSFKLTFSAASHYRKQFNIIQCHDIIKHIFTAAIMLHQ